MLAMSFAGDLRHCGRSSLGMDLSLETVQVWVVMGGNSAHVEKDETNNHMQHKPIVWSAAYGEPSLEMIQPNDLHNMERLVS